MLEDNRSINHTSQQPTSIDESSEIQRLQQQVEQLHQCLKACEVQKQRLAALPQIIWIAAPDGSSKEFNSRWYEYTGLTEAESLGWEFLQAIHPQDRDRVFNKRQQAFTQKQPFQIQYRLKAANGSYKLMLEQAAPVIEEDGIVEWIVETFHATFNEYHPETSNRYEPRTPNEYESALEQLEKEQEFLKALLANLTEGIVACDANGVLTLFNQATQEFHGLPQGPIPAENWGRHYDLYHADGRTPMLQQDIPLFRALNGENVRDVEMAIIPKQGRARTLIATGNAIVNAQGKKLGAVVVMRDITASKQAELKIRALNAELEKRIGERIAELDQLSIREQEARSQAEIAKERFYDLVNGLTDAVFWECNATTMQFSFVSESAKTLFGYPVEAWLDQPDFWLNLIHPSDREWVANSRLEEISQGHDREFEYRCIAADGRIVWIRDRAYIVQDAHSQVQKLRGLMIDITQTKQAQQELQESEARFSHMANTAPVMIWVASTYGVCNWFNKPWLNFTGRTLEQELGNGWAQGVHPDDLQRCLDSYLSAFNKHQPLTREYRLRRADGEYRTVLDNGVPRFTPSGEFAGYIGSCIDISNVYDELRLRIAAEEALKARAEELTYLTTVLAQTNSDLEKRNQELDQFAYVTSHDLKAPLRAIANLSQWIEEDISDLLNDENRHQMNLLRGRVHRLESLIDALLQFSRVGRIKTEAESVDVADLITEVLNAIDPPPEFNIIVEPEMPTLVTQRLPLFQVFSNLISNAIKHHDRPNGQVTISVAERGQFYEFAVADDGAGIAPQYHEKVFTIFQTLQARDQAENTGIGLAIVKKIVEAQGGRIYIESSERRGATFRFTWAK